MKVVAVVAVVAFLIVAMTSGQSVTLSPCVNKVAQITNMQSTRLTCQGIPANRYVEWRYVSTAIGDFSAGVCPPPGQGSCQIGLVGAAFTASRSSSTESYLHVDNSKGGGSLVAQGSLYCQSRTASGVVLSKSDTCQLRVRN